MSLANVAARFQQQQAATRILCLRFPAFPLEFHTRLPMQPAVGKALLATGAPLKFSSPLWVRFSPEHMTLRDGQHAVVVEYDTTSYLYHADDVVGANLIGTDDADVEDVADEYVHRVWVAGAWHRLDGDAPTTVGGTPRLNQVVTTADCAALRVALEAEVHAAASGKRSRRLWVAPHGLPRLVPTGGRPRAVTWRCRVAVANIGQLTSGATAPAATARRQHIWGTTGLPVSFDRDVYDMFWATRCRFQVWFLATELRDVGLTLCDAIEEPLVDTLFPVTEMCYPLTAQCFSQSDLDMLADFYSPVDELRDEAVLSQGTGPYIHVLHASMKWTTGTAARARCVVPGSYVTVDAVRLYGLRPTTPPQNTVGDQLDGLCVVQFHQRLRAFNIEQLVSKPDVALLPAA
jgi:hypothetical protein